jgi:lipoate-protein ligase A
MGANMLPEDQKQPYRLIKYASENAAINMAIDEAILEAHLACQVPPTLRIYQFAPPAVSFGHAQTVTNELIDKIKGRGFDVVRRPTGGRAVLHLGDLTYAFICSTKGAPIADYVLVGESVTVAYKEICRALILSLRSLGAEVTLSHNNGNYKDKQDCFLASTAADLQYQGKKIVGSAQLRRRHAVLQHGSIILNQPQSLLQELLGAQDGRGNNNNQSRHANLYEIIGQESSIEILEKTLKESFEQIFEHQFISLPLTRQEKERAVSLCAKYKGIT